MTSRDAWVVAQKRAFTGWMNIQLAKRGIPPLNDIFTDLEDGVALCQLTEIILDVKIRYTPRDKIKLVFQKLENLQVALAELKKRVFVSADAKQIQQGDPRMILGMLWTCILRVQISDISIEQRTAKEGLLLWCQRKTAGYQGVNVVNFTHSWKDGLAFCALIHKHHPALIPYETLTAANAAANLNLAFDVALQNFGIPKMLDATEIMQAPDELSVMTYITQFFHHFSKGAKTEVVTRRVAKIIDLTLANDEAKAEYIRRATEMVQLLETTCRELEDRTFDNTLPGAVQKMKEFEAFKSTTKTGLTSHKLEVEALFNNIAMKLRTCNRPPFHPPEECAPQSIDALWARMEQEEEKRAIALREELLKQKKLANCQAQFEGKILSLEHWCADKKSFLENANTGDTLHAVQNNTKMHVAFEDEYTITRQAREPECVRLADEMIALHFQEAALTERIQTLKATLDALKQLSDARKATLDQAREHEVEKEKMRKDFAGLASDFVRWVRESLELLADHSFPDGLEAITAFQAKLAADEEAVRTAGSQKFAAISELNERMTAAGITDNKYTAVLISDIVQYNEQVSTALARRQEAFAAELERQKGLEERRIGFAEEAKAFVDMLAKQRAEIEAVKEETIEATIAKVNELFNKGEEGQSRLKLLDDMDKDNTAAGITTNQHTQYTMPLLNARWAQHQRFVDAALSYLSDQIVLRDRSIAQEAELAMKDKRDALCIEFAQKAIALQTYMESVQSALTAPHVETETLPEAQQFKEQFEQLIVASHEQMRVQYADVIATNERMKAEGVTTNPFCHLTMEALTEKWDAMEKSIDERKELVAQELERQGVCEGLRTDFAQKAMALVQFCEGHKKAITSLAGELPEQLAEARRREGEIDAAREEQLAEVQRISASLAEMGSSVNEHTDLDIHTVNAMYENLVTIVKRTVGVIDQRITALRMGDITPEELEEYHECFDHFDQDHSGDLQKLEFKACLAGLGQEVTDAELDALMKQLAGPDGSISFDNFTKFMKNRTKDTDSKDEVVAAFKEIAKDKPFVTVDDLRAANVEPKYLEYLVANMPPMEGGLDYTAFTEAAYSR